MSCFQDGNFTRADIMPTESPAVKIVGQSTFVDFGENCMHFLSILINLLCFYAIVML